MRAVIQRVSSASVTVAGEVVSQISKGLLVLVGLESGDTEADIQYISNKILTLRMFNDVQNESVMWKSSLRDIQGEVLCVSQFTLLANTIKNKPDFHRAMPGTQSRDMYALFLKILRDQYVEDKVKDGKFGAMMNVSLTNEGPVTFTIDSPKPPKESGSNKPSGANTPISPATS